MKHHRILSHRDLQHAPVLATVSDVARSNRTPRSLAGIATAAHLWAGAIEGEATSIARELGISQQVVSRYGTGERLLPLGDVIAAPAPVAQVVLRRALEVSMATPWRGEESEVREAIKACGGASELAYRLASCAPEAMTASAREELAEWAESIATRLWALAQRLRRGGAR